MPRVLVGCLPSYDSIGMAAPVLLIALRLLQGWPRREYGGAAIYVAEHAPDAQRGYYTSWIRPWPGSACCSRWW